jgi:hypothetical protein
LFARPMPANLLSAALREQYTPSNDPTATLRRRA